MAERSYSDLANEPDIVLQAWGSIAGTIQWGEDIGANETIQISLMREADEYPEAKLHAAWNQFLLSDAGRAHIHEAIAVDQDGTFQISSVLPATYQLDVRHAVTPLIHSKIVSVIDGNGGDGQPPLDLGPIEVRSRQP